MHITIANYILFRAGSSSLFPRGIQPPMGSDLASRSILGENKSQITVLKKVHKGFVCRALGVESGTFALGSCCSNPLSVHCLFFLRSLTVEKYYAGSSDFA
jgi:hypothetical protein